MKKTKKNKIYGEKLIVVTIAALLILLPVINVYSKAMVSETNIKVEQLKSKIEYQTNINESIDMKISELASLDKVQAIANELGLSYNNDNIKIVAEK